MIDKDALSIISHLKSNGFMAVLAGGCVRDLLLNNNPNDWDIATNARPEVVERLFSDTIPVGKSFGVIIVKINNKHFEVATFRSDSEVSDGRRPESVFFGDIEADALRRDFTINGLFMDDGKIMDFVGGQKDIKQKVIRFIGDPEKRIEEDSLRLMRAVRFAARLNNFNIDSDTFNSIADNAFKINRVSPERIFQELLKMLRFPNSLRTLKNTNILKEILPEINDMVGCTQPVEFHPEGDVFEHTISVLENLPKKDCLLLGGLLHDVGKPSTRTVEDRIRFNDHPKKGAEIAENILRRLRCANEVIIRVVALVANHMRWMNIKQMKKSKQKRFLGMDHFEDHRDLHRADCLSSNEYMDNLIFADNLKFPPEEIKPKPLINGKDLISFGLVPGPIFKKILSAVETEQLEENLSTKSEAIEFVSNFVGR
jgi:poly(A) polymerase